ncbi:hypothetical protein AGIG_G13703 [Arapaima gigas]
MWTASGQKPEPGCKSARPVPALDLRPLVSGIATSAGGGFAAEAQSWSRSPKKETFVVFQHKKEGLKVIKLEASHSSITSKRKQTTARRCRKHESSLNICL